MSNTDDWGLLPPNELPDDTVLLKEYIARLHELLGTYVLQYSVLKETNADLRQKLRHLESFRCPN